MHKSPRPSLRLLTESRKLTLEPHSFLPRSASVHTCKVPPSANTISAYPTRLVLILHCPLGDIGWPYLGKATAATRTALPFPIDVCSRILIFSNNVMGGGGGGGYWLGAEGLTCAQMMHAITHWSCTNTVESARKVDFGRKTPCCMHLRIKPASAVLLVFRSQDVPTELFRPKLLK